MSTPSGRLAPETHFAALLLIHMAELLEIVAHDDQTVVLTIETLAIPQSPK